MPWVKTDDGAPLHPKFFRAGVAAYGWWHAALSYCNRWLTDGFLPERDLDLVFPGTPHEATAGYVEALVREGSLKTGHKKDVKGYVMHAYHEYQPRRSVVMKQSRMRAEVGRQGGVKSGQVRKQSVEATSNQVASPMLNPVRPVRPSPSDRIEEEPTALSGERPTLPPESMNGHHYHAQARELLAFLNEKTGRSYRPSKPNINLLVACLKSGATPNNIRGVIVRKQRAWGADPKMREYLRPATLFNATKFEQYIGERPSV